MMMLTFTQALDSGAGNAQLVDSVSCGGAQSHNRGNCLEDMQKILLERYQRLVLNTIDDILGWDPRLALMSRVTNSWTLDCSSSYQSTVLSSKAVMSVNNSILDDELTSIIKRKPAKGSIYGSISAIHCSSANTNATITGICKLLTLAMGKKDAKLYHNVKDAVPEML
nr:hypothetical protein [Tanacetum cinerariifolium]